MTKVPMCRHPPRPKETLSEAEIVSVPKRNKSTETKEFCDHFRRIGTCKIVTVTFKNFGQVTFIFEMDSEDNVYLKHFFPMMLSCSTVRYKYGIC